MEKILEEYLKKYEIRYVIHKHKAVYTVIESAKANDIRAIPGMHCKTLFLSDGQKYYLVGMPAHKRLDIKKLERYEGVKKLRFASVENLKEEINVTPGSVSIFGAIHSKKTKLIIDFEVWSAPVVGFHPNVNTETLELTHESLEKYYNSLKCEKEVVSF